MENTGKRITLPSPADTIVTAFVDKIVAIHPGFIHGVYLTGSIPMNDFYATKSDIDFIVLCNDLPDSETVSRLYQIHREIAAQFPKPDLSGWYLASAQLQTKQPDNIHALTYHEGAMRYGVFDMAPVSLSELRMNAVTVFGEQAGTLLISVTQRQLHDFLYHNINAYWASWLRQHSSFLRKKLLLLTFPRYTEWVILGTARQLCTLQTGKIVSKTDAGRYCLEHLPQRFHPILHEALQIRTDNRTFPLVKSYAVHPSFRRLSQTIECADYIISRCNETYWSLYGAGENSVSR